MINGNRRRPYDGSNNSAAAGPSTATPVDHDRATKRFNVARGQRGVSKPIRHRDGFLQFPVDGTVMAHDIPSAVADMMQTTLLHSLRDMMRMLLMHWWKHQNACACT